MFHTGPGGPGPTLGHGPAHSLKASRATQHHTQIPTCNLCHLSINNRDVTVEMHSDDPMNQDVLDVYTGKNVPYSFPASL